MNKHKFVQTDQHFNKFGHCISTNFSNYFYWNQDILIYIHQK